MAENIYLLEIAKGNVSEVAKRLGCDDKPTHVRLSTATELPSWGFKVGMDGWLMGLNDLGAIVGSQEYPEVPHILVPWSQVHFLSDGTSLSQAQSDKTKSKKKK
ncbi:MAG: hypothetical protein ABIJ09_02150 [Pseudomonadota bacterium]